MSVHFIANPDYTNKVIASQLYRSITSYESSQNIYIFPEPLDFINELKNLLQNSEHVIWMGCARTGLLPLLSKLEIKNISAKILGYNEIPFFFQFPKLEVTLFNEQEKAFFETLFHEMKIETFIVEDSPGLVSARVISMIVNEACFMVNEKIADFQSIDLGMKLGTNYPNGPSEWLHAIGVDSIYHILQNLHHRNPTGRYKITPYLQNLYMKKIIQSI